MRNSAWTQHLIDKYGITPIVLVRNLADLVISLRDHVRRESTESSMAFLEPYHLELPDAELEECIAQLAMPWYLNFYMGWQECRKAKIMFYEDMIADKESALRQTLDSANVRYREADIAAALNAARDGKTRLNVGVSGRGKKLAPKAAEHLARLLDWYPDMKDDRLFTETRASLNSVL